MLCRYDSPLGALTLESDGAALTGLYFGSDAGTLDTAEKAFAPAVKWLDIYFSGGVPDFTPELRFRGTDFQLAVWNIIKDIPYGRTMTYSEIARQIAVQRGISRMSARAVGGAVGRNPISIIVPCHRVVGSGGTLVGYSGGLDKKTALLRIEGISLS